MGVRSVVLRDWVPGLESRSKLVSVCGTFLDPSRSCECQSQESSSLQHTFIQAYFQAICNITLLLYKTYCTGKAQHQNSETPVKPSTTTTTATHHSRSPHSRRLWARTSLDQEVQTTIKMAHRMEGHPHPLKLRTSTKVQPTQSTSAYRGDLISNTIFYITHQSIAGIRGRYIR